MDHLHLALIELGLCQFWHSAPEHRMDVIIRATVIYWVLWLLLRLGGKRELAEMTPFELIVLIVLGDLVQQGVTSEDSSVVGAVLAVGTIMAWTLGSSYAAYRSRRLAAVLESAPALVVVDGVPQEEVMRRNRLSWADLLDEARNHGFADLVQIRYGVLEADGKFSFVAADAPQPVLPDTTSEEPDEP